MYYVYDLVGGLLCQPGSNMFSAMTSSVELIVWQTFYKEPYTLRIHCNNQVWWYAI